MEATYETSKSRKIRKIREIRKSERQESFKTHRNAQNRAKTRRKQNAGKLLYPLGTKTQRRAIVEALINRESMTGREMQAQLGIMCYTKRISEINDLTQLTNVGIIKSWKKVRTRWGNGFTRVAEYHLVKI